MALPSLASRLSPARREPVALIGSENVAPAPASPVAALFARVKSILADRSDNRIAQLVAGKVFLVRVGSALLALASQVLLARWMGSFEFGIYIYVWTWVLMIGALSDMGLSSAARRSRRFALARTWPRHGHRRNRRHRRDAARALPRQLLDRAALSRLRHP